MKKWEKAMKEEMDSLAHNQTWDLVRLPAGSNMQEINVPKRKSENSYAMKDLGVEKQIIGMRKTKDMKKHKLTLSQSDGSCKQVHEQSKKEHWMVVKWILRYLRGTTNQALFFGGSKIALQGYVNVDMVGDRDNRRSTIGYVFTIGGITINWVSKLQSVVALSRMEAEYVVATKASKEMIWLQRFLDELGKKKELGRLYSDNQSAIHLAKNSTFHSKTKHIQLKYHFIRLVLEDGQLKLEKIHTSQNLVDMLTKVVSREKLRFHSFLVGLQV
eukprot:PITA_34148